MGAVSTDRYRCHILLFVDEEVEIELLRAVRFSGASDFFGLRALA